MRWFNTLQTKTKLWIGLSAILFILGILSYFGYYGLKTAVNSPAQYSQVLARFSVAAILGIFAIVALAFLTARAALRPLEAVEEAMARAAAGDLSVEFPPEGAGSMGVLFKSFSEIVTALKKSAGDRKMTARLSEMLEKAPVNILFADENLKLTYINPSSRKMMKQIEHLLPCRVEEMIGQSADIFHPEPGRVRRELSDLGDTPRHAQIKVGDEQFELFLSSIYDASGHRMGVMATWNITTSHMRFLESLSRMTESMALASEELSACSQQMNASSEQASTQAGAASAASHQTNRHVQSVATSAEQMSATVQEISKNLQDATRITTQAVKMAESANATISKLGDSSAKIGDVLKVITSIAQQTNLLALNATIEAARAGEAGKGFAVVANEVKELAKGTEQATAEIGERNRVILEDMQHAVEAIADIRMVINQTSDLSTMIAGAVEEQSSTSEEITRGMSSAAKESHEVVQAVSSVLDASQSTVQGANNIRAASQGLARMVGELQALTADLSTGGEGSG